MRWLTEHQHGNADETADSWDNETRESGPFASHWLPVHQKHAEKVSRDFYSSGDECVDENVAMKRSGIESHSEVYQTACEPVQYSYPKLKNLATPLGIILRKSLTKN